MSGALRLYGLFLLDSFGSFGGSLHDGLFVLDELLGQRRVRVVVVVSHSRSRRPGNKRFAIGFGSQRLVVRIGVNRFGGLGSLSLLALEKY